MIKHFIQHLQTHLLWKLLITYLIVIFVGIITLTLATEALIPTAFNRHMQQMEMMLDHHEGEPGLSTMQDDLFSSFRRAVTEALFVSAATALLGAILVSVFVSRQVVRPIIQMTKASQRIADGQYQERVETIGADELGKLAYSFNQMAYTLAETETMRRNLIADVSHELRTPLSSIKGYMEGLIDNVLPATPETYQLVYREADRLQGLVADLQDLSQVEAQAFRLNKKSINLTELIDRSVSRLNPQFIEKNINLAVQVPTYPIFNMGDEDRLGQVLLNLLGNALQYTPGGGQVSVKLIEGTQQLEVSICDTGIGIPAESLPHIFTRFYRVDKSRSRVGGGSGIGLTIAKSLIERHEGQIWATSDGLGHGSCFYFVLPYTPSLLREESIMAFNQASETR